MIKITLNTLRKLIREAIEQDEFGAENTDAKREIVVLVGPPAVGKSTYIARKFPKGSVAIVSRDDIADSVAAGLGLTYDDLFITPPPDAELGSTIPEMEKFGVVVNSPAFMTWAPKSFDKVLSANNEINAKLGESFASAVNSDKHVVVDMTNMNAGARKAALSKIAGKEDEFFKRAVVFKVADSDIGQIVARSKARNSALKKQGKSKTIEGDIIERMMKSFQAVSAAEGFDKVDTIDTFMPLADAAE